MARVMWRKWLRRPGGSTGPRAGGWKRRTCREPTFGLTGRASCSWGNWGNWETERGGRGRGRFVPGRPCERLSARSV
nr:MAG: hypothetical protein DIU72_11690 [Pseudomonadota bacterium]